MRKRTLATLISGCLVASAALPAFAQAGAHHADQHPQRADRTAHDVSRQAPLDAARARASTRAAPRAQSQSTPPGGASANQTGSRKKPTTLATVIVTTGTRALDVAATDAISPVTVISGSALQHTGMLTAAAALQVLLPSLNLGHTSTVDQSVASSPAQLRGLSPDETLVLVNGKRLHKNAVLKAELVTPLTGSSGTDLGQIPVNAIERIEVLRDGAAAQYGSSAIAGVINIILKGSPGNYGAAGITVGQNHGNMGFTNQGTVGVNVPLGSDGWVHFSALYRHQNQTNHAGPDMRAPGDPQFGKVTYQLGRPKSRSIQGALNLQYDLTSHVQLYGFSIFSKRHVDAPVWPRLLSSYQGNGSGAETVYPNGFRPDELTRLNNDNEVLGVRGEALGWHYDFSANTGGNRYRFALAHSYNYSLGTKSPTFFFIGGAENRQWIFAGNFVKAFDVDWLGGGPLSFAWGLAWRHQKFSTEPGDPASYFEQGSQAFRGIEPENAGSHTRTNKAVYVDLTAPFTAKLKGEFAVRHEKYSDFGSTTPVKLGLRYQANHTVAFRVTASTGFRAPSLAQEYHSLVATNRVLDPVTGKLVPTENGFFPVSNPAAQALGATPLQAEKSVSYDAGMVITPSNRFNLTVGVYQIRIRHRIAQTQNFHGPAVQAFLTSIGFPFIGSAAFFTNAVDTRTRGGDLEAAYLIDEAVPGTLKLTAGFNYNKTTITSVAPIPEQLGLAGVTIPLIGEVNRNLITNATPKTKSFLGGRWGVGNWIFRGRLTRYGKWTYFNVIAAVPQRMSAKVLADTSIAYDTGKWSITAGANNLFNTFPDQTVAANSVAGNIKYPLGGPFGLQGAFYYLNATFRW